MGKFVTEWNAVTAASKIKLEEVDVATGVATLLAVKDEQELVSLAIFWNSELGVRPAD